MFGPAEEAVVTALLDGTADAPAVKMLKCNDSDCYDVGEQTAHGARLIGACGRGSPV